MGLSWFIFKDYANVTIISENYCCPIKTFSAVKTFMVAFHKTTGRFPQNDGSLFIKRRVTFLKRRVTFQHPLEVKMNS